MPKPRWPDENEFYENYFCNYRSNDDACIWLDVSNEEYEGYKDGTSTIMPWISWVVDAESIDGGAEAEAIALSATGQWKVKNENYSLDVICVRNIIPAECYSKCSQPDYCRYKDSTRTEVQCLSDYSMLSI